MEQYFTQDSFLQTMKEINGYWQYEDGTHLAELTSGKISDTFVNCSALMEYPHLLQKAVSTIIQKLPEDQKPTVVCGPGFGAITLAYEVASQCESRAIFTEPTNFIHSNVETPSSTEHVISTCIRKGNQSLKRFRIQPHDRVLFVEDVVSTGHSTVSSIFDVVNSARNGNCNLNFTILPYIVTLINRYKGFNLRLDNYRGVHMVPYEVPVEFEILSLLNVESRVWDSLEDAKKSCPDVVGAVRPKTNWDTLTK